MSTYKEENLDVSSATFIELPKGDEPDFDVLIENYPPNSWKIYQNGIGYYKQDFYEQAKNEFLKLSGYKRRPVSIDTWLLTIYRKIIKTHVQNKQYKDAYNVFNEAVRFCKDYMTETDQVKYNKILEKLKESHPDECFKSLLAVEEIDIEIINKKHDAVKLVEIRKKQTARKSYVKYIGIDDEKASNQSGRWELIKQTDSKLIYFQNKYTRPFGKWIEGQEWIEGCLGQVVIIDRQGNILKEFIVEHGILWFCAPKHGNIFTVISYDLMLRSFSDEECLGIYDLDELIGNKKPNDRYELRCHDISPEGQYILITYQNKARLMDPRLNLLKAWSTSPSTTDLAFVENMKTGENQDTEIIEYKYPAKIQKSLNVLELSGQVSQENIKKAFRNMVLRYHPDRNPNDTKAGEKTMQVIDAYNQLTSIDGRNALDGVEVNKKTVENTHHYDTEEILRNFRQEFHTYYKCYDWTGNWNASCLTTNANKIYLGSCSGELYCLDKEGHVEKVYNFHDIIRVIRKIEDYLIIQTTYWLYILKNEKYLTHIDIWDQGQIKFFNEGFMIISRQMVRLFTHSGSEIANIKSKNRICDVYFDDGHMYVKTERKNYVLSISTDWEN